MVDEFAEQTIGPAKPTAGECVRIFSREALVHEASVRESMLPLTWNALNYFAVGRGERRDNGDNGAELT